MKELNYLFTVRHLSEEEGSGYLIEFPDLPGCMSDGETIEEAIENGADAVACWIDAAKAANRDIPNPEDLTTASGKWVQRAPKSLHRRLAQQAKLDGVSLNTLVVSMIAQSLGERKTSGKVRKRS